MMCAQATARRATSLPFRLPIWRCCFAALIAEHGAGLHFAFARFWS